MSPILADILNPFGVSFSTFGEIFGILLNVAAGASFAIGTIAIIVSGVQFIMSQGDAKNIDIARKYLTAAVIAIVLSLMAIAFKNIVLNIVGGTVPDVPAF